MEVKGKVSIIDIVLEYHVTGLVRKKKKKITLIVVLFCTKKIGIICGFREYI